LKLVHSQRDQEGSEIMADCSFCGNAMVKGTGKLYVKKDGRIFYFCKMKCEKNLLKLKRVPRTTTWTQEAKKWKTKA